MNSIYGYDYTKLENYLISNNEKKYRTKQIFEWLYEKRVNSFNDMKNLSKELIEKLNNDFSFYTMKIVQSQKDIDVYKYLFQLYDDTYIEAVVMHHDYGYSICLSTQVGCNMACDFCESGKLKTVRNLEVNEMIEPILLIEKDIDIKITRVVLMGIGEPFNNYEFVKTFINHINYHLVLNIGIRHITVSTCGIIPKITEFANDLKGVNLAISLHASSDNIRNQLMPINKVYNINSLIACLKDYIKITNRRVTIEYILLDNINDSLDDATKLVSLLKGMNCYVNLIPYNDTSSPKYKRSSKEKIDNFYNVLYKNNIGVTIRREFGKKIDAACGQLSSRREN